MDKGASRQSDANGMEERIRQQLHAIEREEQVRVLYACESGSRAWGWASASSDFDVRFLYIREPDWYLSLFPGRDVIERKAGAASSSGDDSADEWDMHGWDLRKALQLLHKSNPQLLEWLYSPVRYLERPSAVESIRRLSQLAFSPKAGAYHYLHMAHSNYQAVLQDKRQRTKSCLHALRSALAGLWIVRHSSFPPLSLELLADELLPPDSDIRRETRQLLACKRAGQEAEPNGVVLRFLHESIAQVEQAAAHLPVASGSDGQRLDALFRAVLHEGWAHNTR